MIRATSSYKSKETRFLFHALALCIASSGCFISPPKLQGPSSTWINFSEEVESRETEQIPEGLNFRDIDEISSTMPHLEKLVFDHRGIGEITRGEKSQKVFLGAVSSEYFSLLEEATDATMVQGEFVSTKSETGIVITDELARSLFPAESPIGKTILIGEQEFRIQGIINYRKISLMGNLKRDVFIPLDAFNAESLRLNGITGKKIDELWVKVKTRDQVKPVRDAIQRLLLKNHPETKFSISSDF